MVRQKRIVFHVEIITKKPLQVLICLTVMSRQAISAAITLHQKSAAKAIIEVCHKGLIAVLGYVFCCSNF